MSATMKTGAVGLSTNAPELQEMSAGAEDVRRMSVDGKHPGLRERLWGLEARFDRSVTLEEYMFWAKVEREMEEEEYKQHRKAVQGAGPFGGLKAYYNKSLTNKDAVGGTSAHTGAVTSLNEKSGSGSESPNDSALSPVGPSVTHDYDAEWRKAARALRTAGFMTVFWLVTTDILGWGQTPFVFASNGYNYAIGIFVLFGIAAISSGLMIWWTFLGLDSSRFPMLSFGDPFFRLFGPKTRHFINITQAFQMFCTVAVIVLGNAQIISQLSSAKLCFIACGIITVIVGILSCVMRSLKHIGWFANASVWINVVSFIIILVVAPKYGPDVTVVNQVTLIKTQLPVTTFWTVPPPDYQQQSTNLFAAQFNGIDSIVYAYSGALLFIAFMSEMRRPWDFWKGAVAAQVFIMCVYIIFGAVVYTFLGQYSYTTITQVVNPLSVQIASNALALVTSFLAVFMYFNIGMKVVYLHIGQELFGLPSITTKKGYVYWLILGPVYWLVAYVFAMSVPNFSGITNLIGGLLSLNFTYSIPAIMFVAYMIQSGAALPGEGFDPYTGVTTRHDEGFKRYMRGIAKTWYVTIPAILFAIGGLAASGMGSWSAIVGLEQIFGQGASIQTSWSCAGAG